MDSVHPISARLKQARELRNLSVTELSKLTNIRIHIIQALDEGRVEELPKVYMRSFVKRYALAVGISSDEIEDLMNKHLAAPGANAVASTTITSPIAALGATAAKAMKTPIHLGPSKNRRRFLMVLYSVLGVAGIGGLYYMYAPSRPPQVPKAPLSPSVIISDKDSSSGSANGGLMNYFGLSSVDSVSLEATTTDTVWLNITADGKSSEQLTLLPHQSKRWVAAEKFLLSVGNAGGIVLRRNGQELPPLGKLGETVRSIRITRSEFVTSASPWKSQRDTVKKVPPAKALPTPANTSSATQKANATKQSAADIKAAQRAAQLAAKKEALLAAQKAAQLAAQKSAQKPQPATSPSRNVSPNAKPAINQASGAKQNVPTQRPTSGTATTGNSGSANGKVQPKPQSAIDKGRSLAPSAASTTRPAAGTAAQTKPGVATDQQPKSALSAKQRQDLAEKKKRLERIRREAARAGEITPAVIK